MDLKFTINKILNRGGNIISEFKDLSSDYSIVYATINLLWWISYYLHFKRINKYTTVKKQKFINSLIETLYPDIIARYKTKVESQEEVKNFKIWVFWAQGENRMPLLVKSCYEQLKKIEGDNVILITMENIHEFVDFPSNLLDLLNSGKILYAHFSDILRNYLISRYGGAWYDATCWITSSFPDKYKNLPYFSPRNKKDETEGVVYALGSGRLNSVTFCFVREILLETVKTEKRWPDYLFQDYVFNYARRNISATKEALKILPDNNTNRFLLFSWMNSPFNQEEYDKLKRNNWIFKLSYKAHYKEYDEGKPTFYHQLIHSV